MRIREIRFTPFSIPFVTPLDLPGARVSDRRGLLVEVEAAGGERGLGEAAPHPAASPEMLTAAATALRALARRLIGAEVSSRQDAFAVAAPVENRLAQAGLEAALCDAASRSRGVRLAEFLDTGYASPVAVNATVAARDPRGAAVAAAGAVARGFSCLKLKVGALDRDQVRSELRAVREAVGPSVQIRLDANASWSVEEAIRILTSLSDDAVEYVEQPVADLEGMAAVRRATSVPLAADELVLDTASVHRVAAARAADVVIVKPSLLGLSTAGSVMAAAAAHGLDVVVTSVLDTSVGIAAALALAASVRPPRRAAGLATVGLLQGDLVPAPPRLCDGEMYVPNGAGSGVVLDAASIERWRTAATERWHTRDAPRR